MFQPLIETERTWQLPGGIRGREEVDVISPMALCGLDGRTVEAFSAENVWDDSLWFRFAVQVLG